MDFPIFHLDFFGDRLLIAIVAILHVLINHAMAVGGIPLVLYLELHGSRQNDPLRRQAFDELARRLMFMFFLITTTIGALTGVGIWFTTAVVNPAAIGSLIRVFYWAWFAEWLVFVSEVVLILAYYLTWERWGSARKREHLRLGLALAIMSWVTMALITAILGFMMDPGDWLKTPSFLSGILNPLYLPQLAFRTPLAMVLAGVLVAALIPFFTRDSEIRLQALRLTGRWTCWWLVPTAVAGSWYLSAVPRSFYANLGTALGGMAHAGDQAILVAFLGGCLAVVVWSVFTLWWAPRHTPRWGVLLAVVAAIILTASFERTREFLRKPWIIGGYMYANGYRMVDYPLLNREGVLPHSAYAEIGSVTAGNRVQAGAAVFQLTCAKCHTVEGVNSVLDRFTALYGREPWHADTVVTYLGTMQNARSFMPPFPGNHSEREALAAWLIEQQRWKRPPVAAVVARQEGGN
jgi:mono/diheme cytochrome c family protein